MNILSDTGPVVDRVAFLTEQAATVLSRRIPARFADAVCDHPQVAAWADRFAADPTRVPSLVLTGPTGTGKTRQCWGLLRKVVMAHATTGRRVRWEFTTHPELNDQLRPKPDGSHAWALEPYLHAELLILDDLGAGKQSEWTGDSLHRLVDHRWSHMLPTVYSTNLTPAQLADAVGDRIVSRLADSTRVALKGSDRRREGAA